MKLEFLGALYNEQDELPDLIDHVNPYVTAFNFADDGSIDNTQIILAERAKRSKKPFRITVLEHTGLPETVKNAALQTVTDGSWVLMLDADERFAPYALEQIKTWVGSHASQHVDYVYFHQLEILDKVAVREFQKVKLFRKEAIRFPLNNIHADDQFVGEGIYRGDWIVYHRKTTNKQIQRETEYLQTYRKLRNEGHIDEGREKWLQNLHHFVKPKG